MRHRTGWYGRAAVLSALLVCGAVLAGPAVGTASAQSPLTGVIEGVIRDEQGRPLSAVAVTVISQSTGRRQIVRTSRSGRYLAQAVAPGAYDVLVERLGYHPERVEGLIIAAGETRVLSLALMTVEGDEVRIRTRPAPAALSTVAGVVPSHWYIAGAKIAALPQGTSDMAGLGALSSSAGTRFDIDGLPASTHAVTVDGLQLAKRPRTYDTFTRLASLPLAFFEMASVGSGSPDVEYPGQGGGLLSAHTVRGGPTSKLRVHADIGSDALTFSSDDVASYQTYRAGGLISGPLAGDTASFVLGVDFTRFQTPFASLWVPDASVADVLAAAADHGVDLTAYSGPGLAELERVAAFGRLDAKISESSRINATATLASLPTIVPFNDWTESPAAWQGNPEAREIFAAVTLQSEMSDEVFSETSIGYERSETSRQDPLNLQADPPETIIASVGRSFGSQERRNVDMTTWSFTGRQTFHVRTGDHVLKLGLAGIIPHYDLPWFYGRSGEYFFSAPADLRSRTGRFQHVWGDDNVRANFDTRRITVFAQDTWRPRPGIEVTGGARVSAFRNIDSTVVTANYEWFRLTGLQNTATNRSYTLIEPRFAIMLKPGGGDLTLRAGVWLDTDFADPGILAEIITNDGFQGMRRVAGQVAWPQEPALGVSPDPVPSLTMLGPEFEGPRSSRLEASLSGAIGGGTAVSAGVSVRRTDRLPRRKDLNLSPTVAATDQFGRPIYGPLIKDGALLFAEPLGNRRFVEFDHAFGIEATGESRYVGFTVAAERPFANGFGVWASYTWSRTEDDWLPGNPRDPLSQLNPLPSGQASDWRNGRSDFDVPHRALVGFEASIPGKVEPRVAALYRFQSGYPFTPGFRPGVDANADGSAVNDVAWIDQSVPGASTVLSSWSCLQSQAGGFAERNACRGPDLHALDARLSLSFDVAGSTDVSVVVDAINLIATEDGVVDNALYLVDPGADLIVSPDGRNYTVPLVANPDFGKLLSRFAPQRSLRLGLRVGF